MPCAIVKAILSFGVALSGWEHRRGCLISCTLSIICYFRYFVNRVFVLTNATHFVIMRTQHNNAAKEAGHTVRLFYRVDEVARLIGVTDQTLRNWIREGKIQARRFGRPHMIPLEEVARLLGKSPEETANLLEQTNEEDLVPGLVAA
jgi:excisionase family DNA binding protein